jgi:hypothetical protein
MKQQAVKCIWTCYKTTPFHNFGDVLKLSFSKMADPHVSVMLCGGRRMPSSGISGWGFLLTQCQHIRFLYVEGVGYVKVSSKVTLL